METTNVQMTAEELEAFKAFKAQKAAEEEEAKRKADRQAYSELVDETVNEAMNTLLRMSDTLKEVKTAVWNAFDDVKKMKADLFGTKEGGQFSHTFSTSDGQCRITLGVNTIDAYNDTAEDGVAMVKEYIQSLAKDAESEALVEAVLNLLAKDKKGTLKASRVLQLEKLAEKSGNERFKEGVRIIKEAYQPQTTAQYITAWQKNGQGKWEALPLGMTEA